MFLHYNYDISKGISLKNHISSNVLFNYKKSRSNINIKEYLWGKKNWKKFISNIKNLGQKSSFIVLKNIIFCIGIKKLRIHVKSKSCDMIWIKHENITH